MARIVEVGVLLASLLGVGLFASAAVAEMKVKALYVFGDSYADTGNHDPFSPDPHVYMPWRPPYGYSWPRNPSGRFSDGHVLTDLFASYMRVKRPIPFRRLKKYMMDNKEEIQNHEGYGKARVEARCSGINFAYGGSGVITLFNPYVPNVTTQIQQLSTSINLGIVSIKHLSQSLALFVISGNDYIDYFNLHQTFKGLERFTSQVVEQMAFNLENLSKLGFTKFVITNLGPIECLPLFTYSIEYTQCLTTFNSLSDLHNTLLAYEILNLQEKFPSSTFDILDLNRAFNEVIREGALSIRPCCEGMFYGSCGAVDRYGNPLYTVCSDVEDSLYWDTINPTNKGWFTLLNILLPDCQDSYEFSTLYESHAWNSTKLS